MLSSVQNTANKHNTRGFQTICQHILKKIAGEAWHGARLREICPPLGPFLEWPLCSYNKYNSVSLSMYSKEFYHEMHLPDFQIKFSEAIIHCSVLSIGKNSP